MFAVLCQKMGKTPAQRRRATELRRNEKNARRQAYFIADYIQVKYFHIYSEAARFFNALNTLYPTKYDIRKTSEYRTWRAEFTTGQRLTKAPQPTYTNIDIPIYYQNADQSQSPEGCEMPETEPQSPQDEDQLPEPQSPEGSQSSQSQPQSPQDECQLPEPQSPQDECQLPEPQSPEGSQSSQSQPQSPQDDEHDEQPWKDNMELKIPLIQYKASKSARTITTQTIGIVTEQT